MKPHPNIIIQQIPKEPTFLTQASTNPLTTRIIEHCMIFLEYPSSHIDGYTYCINVQGKRNPRDIHVRLISTKYTQNVLLICFKYF